MISFSSARILNDDRVLELAPCDACGGDPLIYGASIFCKCGNRIDMNEFCESVAAWNRANTSVGDILKSIGGTL